MKRLKLFLLCFSLVLSVNAQRKEFSIITLCVIDGADSIPIPNGEFKITNLNANYSFSVFADSAGFARIKVDRSHVFSIYAEAEQYYDSKMDTVIADSEHINVKLTTGYMTYTGCPQLPDINFDYRKSTLSITERNKINDFLFFIRDVKGYVIEIRGYACDYKSPKENFYLSNVRCDSVRAEILKNSVEARNFYVVRPYGDFNAYGGCVKWCSEKNPCGHVGFRILGRIKLK